MRGLEKQLEERGASERASHAWEFSRGTNGLDKKISHYCAFQGANSKVSLKDL